MTSAARPVSSRNDLELAVQARLSSVNAVFALSAILTQSSSPSQAMRLVTTAVPSFASCDKALAWHPGGSGDYYERAPDDIGDTLAEVTGPRQLGMGDHSSWWVFPLGPLSTDDPIFLVTVGTEPLSDEETFLISVLARLCGTVIAKLELIAAERANIQRTAALNAELESTVSTLTKIMDTHRRLNEIVATAGEAGIATTLYRLTTFPVLIQDVHGNVRASVGEVPDDQYGKERPEQRHELIRKLRIAQRAVYYRRSWLVLANPRPSVVGVIALIDPARIASQTDLAALEYAGTVLSVELARLQSVAEAELRSQRDFAEELLAGADESTVKASAHVLGYDSQRPHRVIIAAGRPRSGLDEQFFQAVVREVRRLDVGSLVVARTDYVVIIANHEADWAKLHGAIVSDLPRDICRLAVGSRYPDAWHVAASYREAQFVANLASSALSNPAAPVLRFESLGVYRMLSSVTDPAGIEGFMNEQLGPLIEYDRQHDSSLLLTLERYFDSGCNYDEAAAALSIHRNTLKYRLKRIRELLGRDPHDGSARLDLHLAIKVWLTLESLRRTE
ncbi:MAG TPA: helix-turn-helix domain-containing protein [Streptosporangiaceae bacterium]